MEKYHSLCSEMVRSTLKAVFPEKSRAVDETFANKSAAPSFPLTAGDKVPIVSSFLCHLPLQYSSHIESSFAFLELEFLETSF